MASFITKKIFFSLAALLFFSAQASLQKSRISKQLGYENIANQQIEIVDYNVTRDFEAVKNIIKEGWNTLSTGPYDEETIREILIDQISGNCRGKKTTIKVARVNGQTAGVMTFVPGYYGMVELLAVGSQFRNKGIGYKLLSAAQELAQKNNAQGLELYVFSHNAPAIKLYEKFGLKHEGFVYNNVALMSKPFNEPQKTNSVFELMLDTQIPITIKMA